MFSEKSLFLNAYKSKPQTVVPRLPLDPQNNPNTECLHRERPLRQPFLKLGYPPNMAAASDVATFRHVVANKELLAIVQQRIPWALVETVDSTRVIERSAEIKPKTEIK